MKTLIAVLAVSLAGCAGGACIRRLGPYGPMPCPEEMPNGRVQCNALCGSYGREMQEFTYEGACVCQPDPNAIKSPTPPALRPDHQT